MLIYRAENRDLSRTAIFQEKGKPTKRLISASRKLSKRADGEGADKAPFQRNPYIPGKKKVKGRDKKNVQPSASKPLK